MLSLLVASKKRRSDVQRKIKRRKAFTLRYPSANLLEILPWNQARKTVGTDTRRLLFVLRIIPTVSPGVLYIYFYVLRGESRQRPRIAICTSTPVMHLLV